MTRGNCAEHSWKSANVAGWLAKLDSSHIWPKKREETRLWAAKVLLLGKLCLQRGAAVEFFIGSVFGEGTVIR